MKRRLEPEVKAAAFFLFFAVLFVAITLTTVELTKAQDKPTESVTTFMATTELSTEVKQAYVEVTETTTEESTETLPFGEFYITGYTPTCEHCCGKSDGITASGVEATVGQTVAMHPIDMDIFGIEYGDSIYIEGIGERVVEDTGCGRGVIDVACESHEECYKVTGYSTVEVMK